MDKINFKGKEISVEEFLSTFFGETFTEKINMTVEDLKALADENILDDEDLENLQEVETAQDLEKFILNPKTQNKGVKELLAVCLQINDVSYNKRILNSCNKNLTGVIFLNAFNFGAEVDAAPPDSSAQISQNDLAQDSAPPETSTPEQKDSPVAKLNLDLFSMQTILKGCKFTPRDDIDATDFEITEKMSVSAIDNFYIEVPKTLQIYYGAAAIITKNKPYEAVAVGYLQNAANRTHIILDSQNIEYNLFRTQNRFYIVLFPQAAKEIFERGEYYNGETFLVECQIGLKELERAKTALCIDFGTSNTAVGSYSIKNPDSMEPEIVEFIDETDGTPQKKKIFPTVVYVEAVNQNKIKYLFGYAALKRVIEKDYNPAASVFYEIKRWINNIDAVEKVVDENGQIAEVSHREIIQAYIDHVLNWAEQYFNRKFTKLHFTAPVKLKDSFIQEMAKMFGQNGREVVDAGLSIDEGVAIIYDVISEQKEKVLVERGGKNKKSGGNKTQKIFIIDCGGGTTDLASCEYSFDIEGYSKKLNIVTRFENGDSNFGGNNITFRILQLLKIKLAKKLQGDNSFSVQTLIEDENKLLYKIDDNHAEESPKDDREIAYSDFEEQYEAAEMYVPTKFAEENLSKRKGQLKRNFYYLWRIAEAYKIQFYRANMDFVSVNFSNAEDRKIGIPDDNKYYLYIRKNIGGELEKVMNPMSGIEITNNDIHRLLYADIYALLKTVLEPYDIDDNEQEFLKYDYYKLSGQSCKITLFNELLKEFIPGKYLRYGDRKKESPASIELKLACINGSIRYMRDNEFGEIKPHITMEAPNLIYDVCKVNVDGVSETYMLQRGAEKIEPAVEMISSNANLVKFRVVSQNGKTQNTVIFEIDKNNEMPTTREEIKKVIAKRSGDRYGLIGQHVINQLTNIDLSKDNSESVFAMFAVPSKAGYGFYIYCLKVKNIQDNPYCWTQPPKYYSFENTALETFFDGRR